MASEARLIVVTDIHGAPAATGCLSGDADVAQRLSLADLANAPNLSGTALHRHLFAIGGMQTAVAALIQTLAVYEKAPLFGLGYSAGGTALWRAAQQGGQLTGVICVSSTRLRNERGLPIPTRVYFGAEDTAKPSQTWCETVPDSYVILPDAAHDFYATPMGSAAQTVQSDISKSLKHWHCR